MNRKSMDWALLFLRLAVGVIFVVHGSQKLFGYGLAGVTGFVANMGFPLPKVFAALLMGAEFGGGILVLLGLLTRLAALSIAIDMAVAIFAVHITKGFYLPNGFEYAFLNFFATLTLLFAGGGGLSLDGLIFPRKHSTST